MDNFDRFWAAYPRKVKKKDARKVWDKAGYEWKAWSDFHAIPGGSPFGSIFAGPPFSAVSHFIADIKNRVANDDRWKRGFIPDPTTYLRGERWNDEIVKPAGQVTTPKPAAHMLYEEPQWMKK